MTIPTIEVRLALAEPLVQKLRAVARTQKLAEEAIVEQALALLFGLDDSSVASEYLFAAAAMREDWDAMPEDWIADEVRDALPSR